MACKECGLAATRPLKDQPSERVFPGYPYHAKDAVGTWMHPVESASLCSYHRRKAEGHFSRDSEYYRNNRGPYEWTQYGR